LREALLLQERLRYKKVIVSYAFNSRFFLAFPDALKILDTHDVFGTRKQKLAEEGISDFCRTLTPAQEIRALRRADRIIAIQDEEAVYFEGLPGVGPVYTIGWDAEGTSCQEPLGNGKIGYIASGNELNVLSMNKFLADIWPAVQARYPHTSVLIAGRVCEQLGDFPNVTKLGIVENLHDLYNDIDFAINPMVTGTGLKIKTLEAIAHGRCVVTSRTGAEGLGKLASRGVFLCESNKDYMQAIARLVDDLAYLRRSTRSAFKIFESMRVSNQLNLKAVLD